MRADYPDGFRWSFADDEELKAWKARLYARLEPYPPECASDGYDDAAASSPKVLPTIPAIEAATRARTEQRRRDALARREIEEATRRASEARPDREGQRRIAETDRAARTRPPMTDEERAEAAAILAQQVRAGEAAGRIRYKGIAKPEKCSVGYCDRPGTISNSTQGGGPFYCREHWREA